METYWERRRRMEEIERKKKAKEVEDLNHPQREEEEKI
jgi:hypothetical protein